MKKVSILIIISFLLFCSGCQEISPILTFNHIEGYTTIENLNSLTFGSVHLYLSGSTTGDKVTVITYGDGMLSELELELDQQNRFNQDVIIQFTHMADDIPRAYSTVVTAYQGNDFNRINLESDELVYFE
jgi:hypothetical protein